MLELEPIILDQRTISRASLGGLNKLKQMDVQSGDLVTIQLAGLTIPQLKDVLVRNLPRKTLNLPPKDTFHFLSCLHAQDINNSLYPESCRQQFVARLSWLSSDQALNMQGIGESTWQLLFEEGLLTDLTNWLALTSEQLAKLPSIGEKRSRLLALNFQLAIKQPLEAWLSALGMPPAGKNKLFNEQELAHWQTLSNRSLENWQGLNDVGEKRAQNLLDFFNHPVIKQQAAYLATLGVKGFIKL